jgi:hypothetical protein
LSRYCHAEPGQAFAGWFIVRVKRQYLFEQLALLVPAFRQCCQQQTGLHRRRMFPHKRVQQCPCPCRMASPSILHGQLQQPFKVISGSRFRHGGHVS